MSEDISCTCFLGHPPCGWCTEQSSCEGCGKSFHDPEGTAICEDCQERYRRLLEGHQLDCTCGPCIAFVDAPDADTGFAAAIPLMIALEAR